MTPSLAFDRFRAAIFDFDETMIDLEAQHRAATAALCAAMGSDYSTLPESFRFSSGLRIIDELDSMRTHFGWNDSLESLHARRTSMFLDELRRAELSWLPGVEKTVRTLQTRGVRLAIASSGSRLYIEEVLSRLNLGDAFDLLVTGEEVARAKPDPEIFLLTAERLGVRPEECCVFEDSSVGVRSAVAAGAFCVAVRNRDAHIPQDLGAANLVIDGFDRLTIV